MHCRLPISDNWTFSLALENEALIKQNLSKSAFLERWVNLSANFMYMGTTPAIRLWTVRWRNDESTTMLLEFFTQRNFAADILRRTLKFTGINSKISFCADFGWLRVEIHYTVHKDRWKARSQLPIVLIEQFSLTVTVEALWAHIGTNRCVRKGDWSLWAQILGRMGRCPPTTVGVWLLDFLTLFAWSYVSPFWHNTGVWQTRTRIDKHDDCQYQR